MKRLPDSEFALPKDRLFPIYDEEHVRSALVYFERNYLDRNRKIKKGAFSHDDLKTMHDRILERAKQFGINHQKCELCDERVTFS